MKSKRLFCRRRTALIDALIDNGSHVGSCVNRRIVVLYPAAGLVIPGAGTGEIMRKRRNYISVAQVFLMLLACVISTAIVGCGKDETAGKEKELVLLCGSSFVPPMKQMCDEFTARTGIRTVYTVAGSEDFLPLIKAGKKGDVLITHDPYLDYVRQADAWADNAHVGFVAPVLAVQKGNPKGIKSITDLTKEGIKVALSNPEYSTCGEMVFTLLKRKGIRDSVLKNVGNRLTKGHNALGTFLKTQTVDAVIMWNGVANTFKDSLDIVPAPYEYDTEIGVHVIGLSHSQYPENVKKLVEFAGTRGKEIFAEHGYVK